MTIYRPRGTFDSDFNLVVWLAIFTQSLNFMYANNSTIIISPNTLCIMVYFKVYLSIFDFKLQVMRSVHQLKCTCKQATLQVSEVKQDTSIDYIGVYIIYKLCMAAFL